VDDPRDVGAAQPVQHLEDDRDLPPKAERRPFPQRVLEVLSVEELHRDVGRPVRVVAEVEDRDHVRVDHPRDGLGLPLEAELPLRVLRDLGEHDLERDVALEQRVVGAVHDAHRALADAVDDVVLAETLGLAFRRTRGRLARLAHPPPLFVNPKATTNRTSPLRDDGSNCGRCPRSEQRPCPTAERLSRRIGFLPDSNGRPLSVRRTPLQ
jgi:hypothetical protein